MANETVGLIADSNRTWARRQYGRESNEALTPNEFYEAYLQGGERVKEIAERARVESVSLLAVWGGSMKNFQNRPRRELGILHSIYERFLMELRDEWMDKEGNTNVRFAHMGRKENITNHAPKVMELIRAIDEHTRNRTGMVMAICLDYDPHDEMDRAVSEWIAGGAHNPPRGWQQHLDLPRQNIEYRRVDLIIRTGLKPPEDSAYDNEFLGPYQHETRLRVREACLPDFTADMFSAELRKFRSETKKGGK